MSLKEDLKKQKLTQESKVQCLFVPLYYCGMAFEKLRDLLYSYYHDMRCPEIDSEAFSILLVLAGKREAMLFQTDFDPRDEDSEKFNDYAKTEKTRALQLQQNIKHLIFDELSLSGIDVRSDVSGHSFFIYSKQIQEPLSRSHLRYLCPYEPEKFTCYVGFDLNRKQIYGFGCFEITSTDFEELGRRLNAYKEVAAVLSNVCVSLSLRFELIKTAPV